jgi:glycosyltransferase involved in cell wall biosynthesis
MKKNKHILVLASTFPASDSDPVPTFVKEQIVHLKKIYPYLTFSVLAPHDTRSQTASYTKHTDFNEYRFHYIWPHRLEKLAGRGIMPQLKKNPLYYFLIPNLFLGELIATKRLIRKLQPDYLYAHWFTPQGVVAAMAAKDTTPVLITTHASDVAVWRKIPFGGAIVRKYINKATFITAVSRRTLDKLRYFFSDQQWNAIKNKVKIIPMGVDLTLQSTSRPNNGQHILFLGRLAEKKGVQYLLPAFAKVLKRYPKAQLTIAGDGPIYDELHKETERLNLGKKVVFTGWIDGQKKAELLNEADIYVVPSIITASGDAEGLPVSLMEGMAAGKICVATNESGADDILTDKIDGFLVPQKDIHALTMALETCLDLDAKQRRAMQNQTMKIAEQFAWHHVAKQHYDFLLKD